jgi:hypothetical protein
MRRLPPTLAVLATIAALLAVDDAMALPLGSRRPPPWFQGWETSVPFVASDYWWWPRYYYCGMEARCRSPRRHAVRTFSLRSNGSTLPSGWRERASPFL